jgi:protein-disulfide isomerase
MAPLDARSPPDSGRLEAIDSTRSPTRFQGILTRAPESVCHNPQANGVVILEREKKKMDAAKAIAVSLFAVAVLVAGSTANTDDNTFGNPKAPVMIEVFSDFQCPGCKYFHDNDFPKIMTDYVVPGKVYVIYRYFPLQMHPYGRACAEYACAAARIKRYQKVADALFAQQSTIGAVGNVEAVADSVLTPTEQKAVKGLLKSPEVQKQIDTDLAEGQAVPVPSTPTLWVTAHGRSEIIKGPINYELFKQYLEALVK